MCVRLEPGSEIWGGGKMGGERETVCGNSCVWLVESGGGGGGDNGSDGTIGGGGRREDEEMCGGGSWVEEKRKIPG